MVDFNAGETVATPAADIVRVLLLQRRDYVIDSLEQYHQNTARGVEAGLHIVRARLRSLFYEMQAALKRRAGKNGGYDELLELLEGKKITDLEKLFFYLNEELDTWKITRLDTQKRYDSTDVETENEAKKL